jgi:hypothetical protein
VASVTLDGVALTGDPTKAIVCDAYLSLAAAYLLFRRHFGLRMVGKTHSP